MDLAMAEGIIDILDSPPCGSHHSIAVTVKLLPQSHYYKNLIVVMTQFVTISLLQKTHCCQYPIVIAIPMTLKIHVEEIIAQQSGNNDM
jgi:hypothetical protein